MIRIVLALVFLFGWVALIALCLQWVPGFADANGPTDELLFSGALELLSFILTLAVIGPLTAQFVKWQQDREWRDARRYAYSRLGEKLIELIHAYKLAHISEFGISNQSQQYERMSLCIGEFLKLYDVEHLCFNAGMHSAGSRLRDPLEAIKATFDTAFRITNPTPSTRIHLARNDLNKIRAIVGGPAIGDSVEVASHGGAIPNDGPGQPAVENDPYFASNDELFVNFATDVSFGHYSVEIFRGVEWDGLRSAWSDFRRAIPGKPTEIDLPADLPELSQQKDAFAEWVDCFEPDEAFRRLVVEPADPIPTSS